MCVYRNWKGRAGTVVSSVLPFFENLLLATIVNMRVLAAKNIDGIYMLVTYIVYSKDKYNYKYIILI